MQNNKLRWNIYLEETLKLFNVWLFGIFIYTLFRIFLMIYFNQKIGEDTQIKGSPTTYDVLK